MTSNRFWAQLRSQAPARLLPLLLLLLPLLPASLPAQSSFGGGSPVTLETPAPLRVKPGETASLALRFRLAEGFHTNSSKPSDEFLIPLKLTWDAAPPLEVAGIDYPAGKLEKYAFSEKPLSVYSGEFVVTTRFKAPAAAAKREHTVNGKLRFQACNNTTCFPPRTMPVQVTIALR